jgi:acyl-homoserine-lactone acylase
LGEYYSQLGPSKIVDPPLIYTCLKEAKAYMLKHFGTTEIRLGDFQKLVRGDKELPIYGLPDVITAMRGKAYKNGRVKINHGETYIGLIRFSPDKTTVRSVVPYGSSNHPYSKHFDDQMEMYQHFKTKQMSFERSDVIQGAKKIYHPQ